MTSTILWPLHLHGDHWATVWVIVRCQDQVAGEVVVFDSLRAFAKAMAPDTLAPVYGYL
jgi:hypothetical protein